MKEVLLLIEKSSHCLSYYDLKTHKRLHTLALPEFPHEFVLSKDNREIYIGHYGVINSGSEEKGGNEIIVADVASGKEKYRISCGEANRRPHGIDIDGPGRLFALAESSSQLLVWPNPSEDVSADESFSQKLLTSANTGGKKSHLFSITRDGQTAYSMNLDSNDVTRFYPFEPDIKPVSLHTGERPEGRLLRADEKVLYVTNRGSETICAVDIKNFEVVKSSKSPGDPVRVFHDTRRRQLLVIAHASKQVHFYDDESLKHLFTFDLQAPPVAMSFNRDISQAYLSVDDNKLHVFDLDERKIVSTIQTNKEPDVSATVLLNEEAPVLNP